jgi:ubiquinone/menaquinone biosynthesis C-methylase UbiE
MTTTASQRIYGQAYGGSAPENYERFFVPAIGGPLAHDLVAGAGLRPGERVLDVACGTGIVTRLAAERVAPGGSVAAVDINPGMLATARAVVPERFAVRWYETSAEAMPLPDAAFDVVFCQLGMQFVADKPAAVREIRRVLAPGGRAYVSVPAPTRFFNVMDDAFARHGMPAAAAFVRMVFSLNNAATLERMFQDAGFREVSCQSLAKQLRLPPAREFLWQYIQSTPLAPTMAELGADVRAALERDIVDGWREWATDDGLTYEQTILLATGRS